jgi:hypothetical protein
MLDIQLKCDSENWVRNEFAIFVKVWDDLVAATMHTSIPLSTRQRDNADLLTQGLDLRKRGNDSVHCVK